MGTGAERRDSGGGRHLRAMSHEEDSRGSNPEGTPMAAQQPPEMRGMSFCRQAPQWVAYCPGSPSH